MEKFTLKPRSIFSSEAFQFMIAEKCNIQIMFYNLTRPILSSKWHLAAVLMMSQPYI